MKKTFVHLPLFLLACISLFCGCRKEEPETPAPKTGQVVFWTASDLGCGNITVTINGKAEVITGYHPSAPGCGANNAATFDLPEGNYSYTAQCTGKTWSGQVTFTAGQCFKLQLTGGSGPGTTTGQATFWTASDLACGNITVNVSGITRTISSYYSSSTPSCGASGTATFDLAPGNYSYTAQCSGKTWSGTVAVTAGGCARVQLTGGATTPSTGKATFWIASDLGCGNITVNVSGITRTISSFYSSGTPACGASGTATFDLAPGTYSYSAQCSGKTWSGTVAVTANGCSRIQLTGGATTPSSGQGMVWIASDFGCGNITVTCNGVTRTISSYYSTGVPACGASGCATFSFSPGTYSFSAKCSNKSWSGSLTITANGCSRVQLTR